MSARAARTDVSQPINWSRNEIICALRETGTSIAQLAKRARLSRFTLYGALERPYPRAHDLIAEALETPRQTIWPAFYRKDGSRREGILPASSAGSARKRSAA